MDKKELIKEELTELLETHYDGSFVRLACDYIRSMGMTEEEVEELLEAMKKQKGAWSPFLRLYSMSDYYTMPCAIMALATFMKPAMFAPFT